MIDDKKIEAAARRYSEVTDCDKQEALLIEEGFKEGAKWAINKFIENLWHPASEEPERMKEIIAYGFYATTIVKWCPNGYITWKDYYEKWHYIQWLYIEDLLPKEGGEQ